MTTLVYRDGVLAADTRSSYDCAIAPGPTQKVFKLSDGTLVGFCGTLATCVSYKDWLEDEIINKTGKTAPAFEGTLITVTPKTIYVHEDGGIYKETSKFMAWGSGQQGALGALYAGCTAEEAVRIACKIDRGSGLPIRTVRFG